MTISAKRMPRRQRKPSQSGAPRARPVDWEGQEQAVLIRWLLGEKMRGAGVGRLYDVIYHPPNGGQRSKSEAARLKRQGVKAGVSDLVVMSARGGWHGLYLEFKATPPKNAALTASQRDWLTLAESRGYCAALARGLEEAKAVLREYAGWVATHEHQGARMTLAAGTEWRKGGSDGDGSTEGGEIWPGGECGGP